MRNFQSIVYFKMVSSEVEDIRSRFKKNHKTREMVSHSSKVKGIQAMIVMVMMMIL